MQAAPRFGYSEPAVARRTPATLKAVSRKAASTGSRARRPAPSATARGEAASPPTARPASARQRSSSVVSAAPAAKTAMKAIRSANFDEAAGSSEATAAETSSTSAKRARRRTGRAGRRRQLPLAAARQARPPMARRATPSRTVKWKGPRARVGERGSNGTRARTPGSAREVHRPARASMGSDRSSRLSRGAARCQRGCMISALPSMLEHIGKYKVLEKIGQGAMGEVYKAHDPILNRFVAVKTISAELGGDDTLRKRFQREAQSAARLNHPHIITVYDYGEEQGKIYMAMELLDGVDLKQTIARRKAMSLDEKLSVVDQIAEGLAFAHANEIVHRDLKPANIHLLTNGQVKIMDFGL